MNTILPKFLFIWNGLIRGLITNKWKYLFFISSLTDWVASLNYLMWKVIILFFIPLIINVYIFLIDYCYDFYLFFLAFRSFFLTSMLSNTLYIRYVTPLLITNVFSFSLLCLYIWLFKIRCCHPTVCILYSWI